MVKEKGGKKTTPTVEININFDGNKLGVDLWIAEAACGQKVKWKSSLPFAVHFDGHSPLNYLVASSGPGPSHTITGTVVWNPDRYGGRKFHYYLAAATDMGTVIIDPDIIVPPGGRGGRQP